MSIARVYTTKGPVRKDGLTCEKCGSKIVKGVDRRITFAVGFRGYEHTRCTRPECYPKPSERESSAVAEVYAAQESVDFSTASSLDDLEQMVDEVAEACESVASEYEANEMYDINYDLQERAEQIRNAGEELASWSDSLDEEPTEDTWSGDEYESFEEAHDAWLEEARSAAESAVNEMDLP